MVSALLLPLSSEKLGKNQIFGNEKPEAQYFWGLEEHPCLGQMHFMPAEHGDVGLSLALLSHWSLLLRE